MVRMLAAVVFALLSFTAAPVAAQNFSGLMTAVSGDSLMTSDGSTIRLFGIDAPETTTVEGWGAKMALDALVTGVAVQCATISIDPLQRASAVCGTDTTTDLGLQMLTNGWATGLRPTLRGFSRESAYLDAERQAWQACAGFFNGKPWC